MFRANDRIFSAELASVEDAETVKVCGWVSAIDDATFTLHDFTGCVEIQWQDAANLKLWDVVEICGKLLLQQSVPTLSAEQVKLLNRAETTIPQDAFFDPYSPWSYLKFRTDEQIGLLKQMNAVENHARNFFQQRDFLEIRTPVLWRSTEEYGRREWLVTSKLNTNKGFVLVQSPMPFNMLCAIGGIERAIQFAHCFRIEEDKPQPKSAIEFTQLNLTMTFTTVDEAKRLVESWLADLLKKQFDFDLEVPFPEIDHARAIQLYGVDDPDFRTAKYFKPYVLPEHFDSFDDARYQSLLIPEVLNEPILRGIQVTLAEHFQSKFGLLVVEPEGITQIGGGLTIKDDFRTYLQAIEIVLPLTAIVLKEGDESIRFFDYLIHFLQETIHNEPLQRFAFGWVENPPFLLDADAVTEGYHQSRMIFGFVPDEEKANGKQRIKNVDLVLNGVEIAGGCEIEYRPEVFLKNLEIAQTQNLEQHYAYHIDALKAGAPPHFNMGVGWERLLWLLLERKQMGEVMLLPKDSAGRCAVADLPEVLL